MFFIWLFAFTQTISMKKYLLIVFFLTINSFAQKQLPDLMLNNLETKPISLRNDFSEKDKLYVFSFWATWCAPCINELDELNELQVEWKKDINFEINKLKLS